MNGLENILKYVDYVTSHGSVTKISTRVISVQITASLEDVSTNANGSINATAPFVARPRQYRLITVLGKP